MTPLKPPQLADLDDPLAARIPRPTATVAHVTAPAATNTTESLADDPLVAIFARVPESIGDGLAEAVRAVNAGRSRPARVSQQDVVGAVLERYVTSEISAGPAALGELVDAYRRRLRG